MGYYIFIAFRKIILYELPIHLTYEIYFKCCINFHDLKYTFTLELHHSMEKYTNNK